jgi:putative protein-disulfide isomerase
MVKTTLKYYFDPLCGWCYAAAPLIHAAAELEGLAIQLHAGGMMSGDNRQTVTPALRNYVMPHDQRIAALTGQPFGEAYFDGLLRDENAVFDSTPPTLAILAAEALSGDEGIGPRGLAMLARIQQAHYAEGQRIADGTVLLSLAAELGFESAEFAAVMTEQAAKVDAHFSATRSAMSQQRLRGFPSLVLEQAGKLTTIDISPFLGQPTQFVAALHELIQEGAQQESKLEMSFCTPSSCA